jgi:EmrB/QacA subfamily drug resistance transporter
MTDEVPAQRRRLDRLLAHGPAAAATPLARGAVSSARPTLALVLLAVAQFMVFLDETVVNVALPSIKTSLDFTQTGLAWVLDAYILIFGGFLLVGGRMADVFGRRRIFALGVAVFGVASLADGLAQSQALLVVARGFQGLGAALSTPAALALVSGLFPSGRRRAQALSIWGALSGIGFVAGVLLGGVITDLASWRWVFLINVPVALAAVVVIPHLVRESRPTRRAPLDLTAAAAVTLSVLALVYALLGVERAGFLSVRTLGLLAVSGLAFGLFVVAERRSETPLIPAALRRATTMITADAQQAILGASLISSFFLLTLYMQQALDYSPLRTGLAYIPLALGVLAGSGLASHLLPDLGAARVASVGLAVSAIGLLWLAQLDDDTTYARGLLPGLLLIAVGAGLAFVSLATAALEDADDEQAGVASGLLNSSAQIGGAVGVAAMTTVAAATTADRIAAGASPLASLVDGFSRAFLLASIVAMLGAALGVLVRRGGTMTDARRGDVQAVASTRDA